MDDQGWVIDSVSKAKNGNTKVTLKHLTKTYEVEFASETEAVKLMGVKSLEIGERIFGFLLPRWSTSELFDVLLYISNFGRFCKSQDYAGENHGPYGKYVPNKPIGYCWRTVAYSFDEEINISEPNRAHFCDFLHSVYKYCDVSEEDAGTLQIKFRNGTSPEDAFRIGIEFKELKFSMELEVRTYQGILQYERWHENRTPKKRQVEEVKILLDELSQKFPNASQNHMAARISSRMDIGHSMVKKYLRELGYRKKVGNEGAE